MEVNNMDNIETMYEQFIKRAKSQIEKLERDNPDKEVLLDFQMGDNGAINLNFILKKKSELTTLEFLHLKYKQRETEIDNRIDNLIQSNRFGKEIDSLERERYGVRWCIENLITEINKTKTK